MNQIKWMGHTETVMEIQKNLRHDTQSCDVVISAKDATVQAHRFVLCSSSDFFRDILQDIPSGVETTIIIPDLKSKLLECVLTFIYTGEVCVSSSQLSDFLESINFLGVKGPISFECLVKKDKQNSFISSEDNYIREDKDNYTNEDKDNIQHEEECSATEGTKEFEYLEVYNDDDKIEQYTIEQIGPDTNNEYILAESSTNTLTLMDSKPSNISLKTIEDESKDYAQESNEICIESNKEENSNNAVDAKAKSNDGYVNGLLQSRNENLEAAIKAVVHEGTSLQKAASTFNISKTVLWRRVKKHPEYKLMKTNPLISTAVEKLAQGETLKSVSLALDIPLSTLHRHKMKLFQEGRLPKTIQIRKKDSKDSLKERLQKAVKACNEGMSQNHAATVFEVPKSTLWRHIKKSHARSTHSLKKIEQTVIVDDVSFSN